MQQVEQAGTSRIAGEAEGRSVRTLWVVFAVVGVIVLLALVFYNLGRWPATWFDEGSHLHVPKTLVQEGVYADRSSEGYRYFGPTLGVGPTVMLPIALAFRVAGIGLLQARLVMALYLVAMLAVFFVLGRRMGGTRLAAIAVALLVSLRAASTLEYGRQVLGEVPALFFLAAALALWFGNQERTGFGRLILVGLLLGLAIVTKSQFLLVIAPGLLIVWIANLLYYRAANLRYFVVPGVVTVAVVAAWQAYQVLYLGPSTWQENFALLRAASAGAAFVFSPELMRASLGQVLSFKVFFGLLPLFVGYGVLRALPRSREGLRWGVLVALILCNLVWYLFASIGWIRYTYLGLALACLCGAALFESLFGAVAWEWRAWGRSLWKGQSLATAVCVALLAAAGLVVAVAAPLALTVRDIVRAPEQSAVLMARAMDRSVPMDAVVETWEPEMGFLTDHNYHYPPSGLLDKAVGYIWRGGPPPADEYAEIGSVHPPYILVGGFARWTALYDALLAGGHYRKTETVGPYELYVNEAVEQK